MTLDRRTVISRALVAGLVAGLVLSVYLLVVVEPVVDDAIALEEALRADGPRGEAGHDQPARFDRDEQVLGGMASTTIYGLLAGAIFGVVYASVRHRLPARSEFTRVVTLAAISFGAVALVPALKYPANPPAVGNPDTVDERAVLYLVLLAVSVAVAVALVHLSGRLRGAGLDPATRVVAVTVAAVAAYLLVLLVLPGTPDAIDPAVPADLIWRFRIRSLGGLALLWATTGLGLGWALDRAGARHTAPAPAPA